MVDGPLCSIYPTDDPDVVTLSSVPFTPLGKFGSIAPAEAFLDTVDEDLISIKRAMFEKQVRTYCPDFHDIYSYEAPQLSMKTKPVGAEENRACYVFRHGPIYTVMSGKIDTIFAAAEQIISSIGQHDF